MAGLDPQLMLAATRGVPKFPTIADVIQQVKDRQNASAMQAQELGRGAQQAKILQLQIQAGQREADDRQVQSDAWKQIYGTPAPGAPAVASTSAASAPAAQPQSPSLGDLTPGGYLGQVYGGASPQQAPQQAAPAMPASPQAAPATPAAGMPSPNYDSIYKYLADNGKGYLIQPMRKSFADMEESLAKSRKAKVDAQTAEEDHDARALVAVHDIGYDPDGALAIIAQQTGLGALSPEHGAQLKSMIQANPTAKNVKSIIDPILAHSEAAQKIINDRSNAEAAKTKSDADKQRQDNEAAGQKATSGMLDARFQAMRNSTPQTRAAAVDAAIDPAKYPAVNRSTKALYEQAIQSGATPEQALAVVDSAAKQVAGFDNERQMVGIRGQQELSNDIGKEKALAPLRKQQQADEIRFRTAESDATKLDASYNKALSAVKQAGAVLDLADQGNKAAGRASSVVTTQMLNEINGLKRYNGAEAREVGGTAAGNAYDRAMGYLNNLKAGQPVTQEIRDSLREFQQILGENAWNTYTRGLDATNKRNDTSFAPTLDKPNIRKSAAGGGQYKVGDTVMYQGKPHKVTGINNGKLVLDGTQ